MKKAAIIRKRGKPIGQFKKWLVKSGCTYSRTNPDFVVSIGGDGTFLHSERVYPGIPKLLVRESKICHKCDEGVFEKMIQRVKDWKFIVKEEPKLEAIVYSKNKKPKKLIAINDIVVRNLHPTRALRFGLKIANKKIDGELIGDGIVVATPFGSSAYYYSITRKKFENGIGVAFNNVTKRKNPVIVKDTSKVVLNVIRDKGVVGADNNQRVIALNRGDRVEIKKYKHGAKIIRLK